MAPVPDTCEEGLSPVQCGRAWRGPLSSEVGKEEDPAFMGHSHMPGTVPAAWGMSWGVGVIGPVFR